MATFLNEISTNLQKVINVMESRKNIHDVLPQDVILMEKFYDCYKHSNDIIDKAEEIAHVDIVGLYFDAVSLSNVCEKFNSPHLKYWGNFNFQQVGKTSFHFFEIQTLVDRISDLAKTMIIDIENYRKKNLL